MRVSLIVAIADNGVIGRDGGLPWRLSSDLKRFKQITMGHHIVMGRKTYESIGRLLPGRETVIVTRQADFHVAGAGIAHSLAEATDLASRDDEIFIIGGSQLYESALPTADRLYLTRVHAQVDGDVRFPELDLTDWILVEERAVAADERNEFDSSFKIYDRRCEP